MQYDRVSGVVMLHIERHLIANAMQTCPVHTTIFTTRAEDNGVLISQLILPYWFLNHLVISGNLHEKTVLEARGHYVLGYFQP